MSPLALEYADAAEELVQEIVRVVKVRRLYGSDHPQRAGVEEGAVERIGALLDEHGAIELKVEEGRLLTEGEPVYEAGQSRESLPRILHQEGIRQVAFYQGLTLQELIGFVDNVARVSDREEVDDEDLVTRLWEENFYHLRYTFVEQLQDEEWVPPSAQRPDPGAERGPIQVDPEETAPENEAIRRVREADPSLYFLDDEDIAALHREMEAEKSRSLVDEGLTCLRELLMNPVGDGEPILDALADMQRRLIHDADYAHVQKLHQLFIPYLESEGVGERGRRTFAEMRSEALSEETLSGLAARIDAGTVEDRIAAAYYRAFAQEDPVALLSRAGDLKRLCQQPAIGSAFREIARDRREAIRAALTGDDSRAAAAAAFLAGHSGDPRLVDALAESLDSASPETRREAIQALKQIGGGRALEAVARGIDDPDPGVRLYALRHLVVHRYQPASSAIARLVEGEEWRERSPTEQRLLFEAYGALGGEAVLDTLAARVKGGGLFRKADPEEAACALVGLGAIGTDPAREIVERAVEEKNPLIARTARQVIEAWERPPEATR